MIDNTDLNDLLKQTIGSVKLEPLEVIRTEDEPYWVHQVFTDYVESIIGDKEYLSKDDLNKICNHFNIDLVCIDLESDNDDLSNRYCEGDFDAFLEWQPSKPDDQDGWFLVMIIDTEDGPSAWWAKTR